MQRPRHQRTGDEAGKASNDKASQVPFVGDAGIICSGAAYRESDSSRSHAGLRGTGTQGPARGATINRSTVHCQSNAATRRNQHQPGSLWTAIFHQRRNWRTTVRPRPWWPSWKNCPATFPPEARARSATRPVQNRDWCPIDHDHFVGVGSAYCRRSEPLTTRIAPYNSGPPTSTKQDVPQMPQ